MSAEQPAAAPTAMQEWRVAWPQPVIGMLGVVVASTFVYTSGIFLGVMTGTFHWTRSQFSSAFTMQMFVGLVIGPILGRIVDRVGPRKVALVGCFTFAAGLSLLGTANGSIWQWRILCLLEGIGAAALSPTVWITAVSGRFNASRGLALAIVLAGSGVATALWPILAVHYIDWLGWRGAFPALAFTAVVVVLPLTLFCFDGPPPARGEGSTGSKPKLGTIIFSRTFLCILFAGVLFCALSLGLVLNLVPILTSGGFGLATAASIASIAGFTTLIGRVVTGITLDRFPARLVGVVSFLIPIPVVILLWQGKGSLPLSIAGVALLGLTTGAESDVLAYVASRRIDRSIFASAYSLIIACYTAAAGVGPLIASMLYDANQSYTPFLFACVPMAIVSAILIWLVPVAAQPD